MRPGLPLSGTPPVSSLSMRRQPPGTIRPWTTRHSSFSASTVIGCGLSSSAGTNLHAWNRVKIVQSSSANVNSVVRSSVNSVNCEQGWLERVLLNLGLVKGTVSRFFLLQVLFHESSSPKPLKITSGSFRISFKNSRRYLQVKVHHRYQRHRWQIFQRYQRN